MRISILALTLTACGTMETPVESEPAWTIDHATTDGALLGVWGNSPDDVWAVGGQSDQPLVMHFDGTTWSRVAVPGRSRLWNVYGFSATDVYAIGERGLILHYDGQTWSAAPSTTDTTLFGLWGASGEDVWIVGGNPLDPPGSAVVLRGTHNAFATVDLPASIRPSVAFKAHGFDAHDVIVVGSTGVLRWNGDTWRQETMPTSEPLLSAWGRDREDVYAVGGRAFGEIVHYDGRGWSLVKELSIPNGLTGVFTSPDAPTIAVGPQFVFELDAGNQLVQAKLPALGATQLHGVWGDGEGTTYVVGGEMYVPAKSGTILRRR
jgi:hypothetical protein